MEYEVKVDHDGNKIWYLNGIVHREGGPAIEGPDGSRAWYINNVFHRDGGPALEVIDKLKCWYRNGKRHREDGPAIEFANGGKQWWINGKSFKTKEDWFNALGKESKIKALFSESFIKG